MIIFLSYMEMLSRIQTQRVNMSDLDKGLFCFNWPRIHIMRIGSADDANWEPRLCFKDYNRALAVHQVMRARIQSAEAHGRVSWRELIGKRTKGQAVELFKKNGLNVGELDDPDTGNLDVVGQYFERILVPLNPGTTVIY